MENTQTQQNTLDPQTVQLAQSIRQVESGGNYQAKGASGEQGAYQFMPGTWSSESKQAGIDAPLDQATPEQQNQVAYTEIKKLKDQGMNVGQIASIWNSGNPDAYKTQTPGTNAEGVDYDTPAYVQKVAQTYQTIKNGGEITPDISGTPNAPTDNSGMPIWQKLLFGLGGAGLAVGAVASAQPELLPEAGALGAEAIGDTATAEGTAVSSGGILNGIKNAVSKVIPGLGIEGAIDTAKNVLGGNSQTSSSDANSGTAQADATQQASEANTLEQENLADEQQTRAQIQAAEQLAQAHANAANQTVTGAKLLQTDEGMDGVNWLGENGISSNVVNGRIANQDQQNQVQKTLSATDADEQAIHKASEDTGDLNTIAAEAKQRVRSDKNIPSTDWAEADKSIDEKISHYKNLASEEQGGKPSLAGTIGQVRSDGYKSYDKTASNAKNSAGKALGWAANKHMLDRSSNKELVSRLHREKQRQIRALKILKLTNGKKAVHSPGKIQKILNTYGKYIGTALGDKMGGPLGAVLGQMVGDKIIKAVDKRYGKNEFEKPGTRNALKILKNRNPKVHAVVERELKKYGVKVDQEKSALEKDIKSETKSKKGVLGETLKHEDIKDKLVDSMGKHDIKTVMIGLEKGYSKKNVQNIMKKLYQKNPNGKFTPKEISEIASKYKTKGVLPGLVKERK